MTATPGRVVTESAHVRQRTTCRLCGGADLALVLPLEPTPLADAFLPPARAAESVDRYPLDLHMCRACGHVQLLTVIDPQLLYRDYVYLTSSSPGLVEHYRAYAAQVVERVEPGPGRLAVEIGSNDGTLLGFLKAGGFRVLGVDPAVSTAEDATRRGLQTLPHFFTTELGGRIREEFGPAALVAANNVFAHADDLGDVAGGIARVLAPDGVFVFEVGYLGDLVDNMVFDWVYHEHLCYHSVEPLDRFLRSHGLMLFNVERNASKGGSLRAWAQPIGGPRAVDAGVGRFKDAERASGLHTPERFERFSRHIADVGARLRQVLDGIRDGGGRIAGFGASATVTTLMYHFGLGPYLDYLVDDNPAKQGTLSPGYHLPVYPSSHLYDGPPRPSHVLVLAWRFADMIISRQQAFAAQGGRFIVPLPDVQVR